MRFCEVCQSECITQIHRQLFFFPGINDELFYTIVLCNKCGFLYADDISSQKYLNSFYQEAEHHLHSFDIPKKLEEIHADFFKYIKKSIPNVLNMNILDVGSSMGHFLNHFKQEGVKNILGLEPSLSAKDLAWKHYGIEIESKNIHDFYTDKKFDLITLCGVLEHLSALKETINKLNELLEEGGYLFIAVPDVESFGDIVLKEPFLEFSLEHINFFSKISLENIFKSSEFEVVCYKSQYYEFYNNNYLMLVLRKVSKKSVVPALQVDTESKASLKEYIKNSQVLLNRVEEKIKVLLSTQEPVIIWGAGGYATKLCAMTELRNLNLLGFIDQNSQLQNKKLLGRNIYPPKWILSNPGCTILIVSSTYVEEIKRDLLHKYFWKGNIESL